MNFEKYSAEFRQELPIFKEMTEKFYNKEISPKDYKGFSGKYGSYAQRGADSSMLRLRMTGGRLTLQKLKFIAECIEKYKISKVHFTTCQTIQLHNLKGDAVCGIMESAIDSGIITWGGGGDFPRNAMVSPLSGVERGEYFDVMPYAEIAGEYAMGFINTLKLPRKLKIGFSNSPKNESHATFRDLGFVATREGLFDVYSAGGLGPNPKMGVCVDKGVDPSQILYYVKAMVETFIAYGNYENRAKARTRYMQDVMGQEEYRKAFLGKLETMKSEEQLDIHVEAREVTKEGDGFSVSDRRAVLQKQQGLYSVAYHPIGGSPGPEKLGEIFEAVKNMEQVELRLGPDETVYIINCTGTEAKRVLEVTDDGARDLFETSVACIGAEICQVGVRDSQGLMKTLTEASRKRGFADCVLPQIHISGCPSSCGTHQIGVFGFHGGVKMVNKVPGPVFTLHVNGCETIGTERFAEQWGIIYEKEIPGFLIEAGEAVAAAGLTFEQWLPGHMDDLRKIAETYILK